MENFKKKNEQERVGESIVEFKKKNKQLNENLTKKVGEVGKVLVVVRQKEKEKHPTSKM